MHNRRMNIRETRKALGLTQAELADKLGVDGSTISRLESGGLIASPRTLLALEALISRAILAEADKPDQAA